MKRRYLFIPVLISVSLLPVGTMSRVLASDAPTETEAQEEDLTVVGFAQIGSESDWRIAHNQSVSSAFTREKGYDLITINAQQKQENQIKAIRSFILQEVDYIILEPIVETGWEAVLTEAKEAGIPVIIDDRQADVNEDLYTCWIGSDFKEEGRKAGEWLSDYLREKGRGGENINIVTLQGTNGSSAQLGRTAGFKEIKSQHSNWKMLEYADGDFTQAKGQEVMESFLSKYDDIDVVISENDNMAFGAVDAIKAAGKTCGPDGDIIILSFDAVRAALEAMISGDINATFECNPMDGEELEAIIRKCINGEEVDKIQYIDEGYFDTSMNLEEILKTRDY